MEMDELQRIIEAILFAAGESVEVARLSASLEVDENEIYAAADALADKLAFDRRGIRVIRLEKGYQMVSSGEMADFVTRTLETRKPPKLSASQLEALTIIAYYQPANKALVEQIRGVDSSYTVGVLVERGMIEPCGHLEAIGRPTLYRTTDLFLRSMGISSIEQLPPLPEIAGSDAVKKLQEQVDALRAVEELAREAEQTQPIQEEALQA